MLLKPQFLVAQESLKPFAEKLDVNLKSFQKSTHKTCFNKASSDFYLEKSTFQNQSISVLTKKQLSNLMGELKNNKDIPYDFPHGGCEERAYLTADWLAKKGIKSGKAFLTKDPTKAFAFRIPHPKKANAFLEFKYHVANFVLVKEGKQTKAYIIDPIVSSAPINLENWRKKLTGHSMAEYSKQYQGEISFGPAEQYSSEGLNVDFKNQEFKADLHKTLEKYSHYSSYPEGEADFYMELEQIELMKLKMDDGL